MAKTKVLVVEDNPMDAQILKLAINKAVHDAELIVVDDGEPALAFLRNEHPYQNEDPPDLVILDLNLKRIDGPEVLACIRQTEGLRHLAVVILSSSPEDVMKSKAHSANGYFTKPIGLNEYLAVGKIISAQFLQGPD